MFDHSSNPPESDFESQNLPWDPSKPGQKVRPANNPATSGVTTGKTRGNYPHINVQVDFGPNNKRYVSFHSLEPVHEELEPYELFADRSFSRPNDLRRLVTWTKIRGDLTNVFYSMEGSNTEFFPHQFKPVLRFVESVEGRILIADEVGLGKTIEAVYIWREIQARNDARRLLVICPSMLTKKWESDLKVRFGIRSTIVNAKTLLQELYDLETIYGHGADGFVLITSLEGIRVKEESLDEAPDSSRKQLVRFVASISGSRLKTLFDLIIVDEAHYLRNPSTASHQTVELFRDRAERLVLLSATPIQTSDENLYNLLRLLDPETFYDYGSFHQQVEDNRWIVTATSMLRAAIPSKDALLAALRKIRSSVSFRDDQEIKRLEIQLHQEDRLNTEQCIFWANRIESKNLFSSYISRTRKRDVFPDRAVRKAQTKRIHLSPDEADIYKRTTVALRGSSVHSVRTVEQFTLLVRQRQMTSCLVAALESWVNNETMREILWEDLGLFDESLESIYNLVDDHQDVIPSLDQEKIEALKLNDTKYSELKTTIDKLLLENPREKVVLFSFFRATLAYLHLRLSEDGISAIMLRGGSGDQRFDVIDTFRRSDGPSVLLSSEVGSEGIDLQFSRVIINYDLPWNPMRVEQRIGRIDRIGQKADKLTIINLCVEDSVDDRIVMRLYKRIGLFKQSIGDLEPIMGELVEIMISDYLDPQLSDADREERMKQHLSALEGKRQSVAELERNALQLMGFTDYLANVAEIAHTAGRWIRPSELLDFAESFLESRYGGTRIRRDTEKKILEINFSSEASRSLSDWIARERPQQTTKLVRTDRPTVCFFSIEDTDQGLRNPDGEYVSITHPLIQWAINELGTHETSFHRCFAAQCGRKPDIAPGVYLIAVEKWDAEGFRKEKCLAYAGCDASGEPLGIEKSEILFDHLMSDGEPWYDAQEVVDDVDHIMEKLLKDLEERAIKFQNDFCTSNTALCEQQLRTVELTVSRRRERLQNQLREHEERLRQGEKRFTGLIKIRREKLNALEAELEQQRDRIDAIRDAEVSFELVCVGIVRVMS